VRTHAIFFNLNSLLAKTKGKRDPAPPPAQPQNRQN
jgi:hypothetical protein